MSEVLNGNAAALPSLPGSIKLAGSRRAIETKVPIPVQRNASSATVVAHVHIFARATLKSGSLIPSTLDHQCNQQRNNTPRFFPLLLPLETLPTNPRDVAPVHDRMRCDAMQQRFHVDAELRLLVSSGSAAGFLTLPSAASSSRCCSGPCSCSWLLFSSPSGESARRGQMDLLQNVTDEQRRVLKEHSRSRGCGEIDAAGTDLADELANMYRRET